MNFELTQDQVDLQAKVGEFARAEIAPRAEELDRTGEFPADLWDREAVGLKVER